MNTLCPNYNPQILNRIFFLIMQKKVLQPIYKGENHHSKKSRIHVFHRLKIQGKLPHYKNLPEMPLEGKTMLIDSYY